MNTQTTMDEKQKTKLLMQQLQLSKNNLKRFHYEDE